MIKVVDCKVVKCELQGIMSTKKLIKTISEKEMDRKEFLKYSGYALLGLVGLKGLVNLLLTPNLQDKVAKQEGQNHGFGSGKYGA